MKQHELAALRRLPAPARWLGPVFGPTLGPTLGLLFGLVLAALLAMPAHAADDVDPPGRVGRLAELNGQVWLYAPDSNEWIEAVRNRPVTTGDRLSTEADGRAEVRIGSTVLRLAPGSELEVLQLDDDHVSLQLHGGSVSARLRTREAADEFSLRTDEGRFRTEQAGRYRFDRVDDTSSATVQDGQALYESEGTELAVQPGQRIEFWKDRGVPQYSITEPRRDDFSNWVASLDARDARGVSTRYVSPEMTGVEDLDRYGRWEPQTEYGAVWIPRTVVAGWAPYRMGHWAWVRPWGWTWVDDAPWGFAPFHYGRWVWYRNAWCWAPGRYVARPVYAPALVAWVGGSNVSVSVTVGSAPTVGWFPLGPREVYVPGYHVSPRYVRNVNVTHVTNITNVTTIINNPGKVMAGTRYVNRGLPNAVTVVPSQVVERRQPVAPAFRPVNDRMLRDIRRERPRAEAPVVAPPRPVVGARPVSDPRTARPGVPRFGRPEGAPREAGGAGPAMVAPSQRGPDPRDARDRRDDRRDDRERQDGRDRRDVREGPAPVREAPPVVRPQPPAVSTRPGFEARPERPPIRADNPRADNPRADNPRMPPPGTVVTPPRESSGRVTAPREERRQHHEAPQPQPQPQPQPRPQVQMQMQAPAPQVRPAPQVVRPPVVPRHEAVRPPQAEQPRREERPDRGGPDRGGERERGERR
ncbi:MAG: hypothetical protein KF891_00415 [Rhizobacter sp.]|nr:hypothetical protein [Rhizobacter sp.]